MLSVFAFLWALAILIHQALYSGFVTWYCGPLIVIAFATLLRPSSLPRLIALCLAQLVVIGIEMPNVTNHWLLVGLGNVTLLTVLATRPGRQPDGGWDRSAVYHALAPPLRLVILGAYAFAFLAKLNPDFFDPNLSCAGQLYRDFAGRVSVFPRDAWTRGPAIWFTVAIEGVIPVLLAIRRTRLAGVFVAYVFHMMMGLANFFDFSTAATAFLVLFLPDDTPERLARLTARHSWVNWCASGCRRFGRAPGALPLVLVVSYGVMALVHRFELSSAFTLRIWVVLAVAALVVLTLVMLDRSGIMRAHSHLQVAHSLYLFGPLLVVLNGLSPYVGLKTEHSFTMFSNLRTEGRHTNHFIVPRGIRVFRMQDDVVRIIDTSSPRLRRYEQRHEDLVWHSFQKLASEDPSASVTFQLGGELHEVPRVGDHPILSRPPSNPFAKLLKFRSVHSGCEH